jgi:tetratricopeptide (TPR) repeat protein
MRWPATVLICLAVVLSGHAKTVTTVVPALSYDQRKQAAFGQLQTDAIAGEKQLKLLLDERKDDPDVLLVLGRIDSARAQTLKPGAKRQAALKEARKYFSRAKEAGSTEPLIETVLAQINEDGSENHLVFSSDEAVDAKIREAERAYERKDFPRAIELYQAALALDPHHYLATLYLGDAYFASGQYVPAITWFSKASELDANRETAFRYCGDALMRTGKKELALEQYVQAVIAEPYNNYTWRALQQGCQALLLKPWVQAEKLPVAEVKPDKDGNPSIGLPEKFTPFDLVYATARSKWQTENLPNKKTDDHPYRQTLEEETAALRTLLAVAAELKESPQTPPADMAAAMKTQGTTLDQLKEIDAEGLLEAHVLFFRANRDIVADFAKYRDENRAKLREYLRKFYLHLP